jgi:hypothetical protein
MLIDHTNYTTTLKQSTNPRGSSPNGNVYFDKTNGKIQLIGVDELATIDFGDGLVPNPLNIFDGLTLRALYNFENKRRGLDESLRAFKRGISGSYRYAGAYNFINGVKLDSNDRVKLRGSGWIEYAAAGDGLTLKDRIYHGVVSLVDIQDTTVPYYTLTTSTTEAALQAATWLNFARIGDINEAVQMYGSTTNGDTAAGNFDYTTRNMVVRARSWKYNPGETTSALTGLSEFSGFSAGYGIGEILNTSNIYNLADVYGAAVIAPWTGMSLERLAVNDVETGFNETDGSFKWILHNSLGGSVQQCAAFLDALALQNADIDSGTGSYNGRSGRLWYIRNSFGKVVTSSVSGEGLFIAGLSVAEKQNVIMTDNSGATKTYPFFPSVELEIGVVAASDPKCWYRVMYLDGVGALDFNTATAVVVNDSSGVPINGLVSSKVIGTKITFAYSYDTNTQAGLASGINKQMVVLVEGDGVASQAITYFTMTRSTTIPVTCAPVFDNNA